MTILLISILFLEKCQFSPEAQPLLRDHFMMCVISGLCFSVVFLYFVLMWNAPCNS